MCKFTLVAVVLSCLAAAGLVLYLPQLGDASSHREAPLISNDPLADNTDVYAFVSPDAPNTVTIIANYIPLELPEGGPNYNTFGENIRYEIHIKNNPATTGDDITYRFTFDQQNEDPTTFFNIRLGNQNLKTTYTLEKSFSGGSFTPIISGGIVPPNNIGPRSIEGSAGLNSSYDQLVQDAIMTAATGEKVFCGPRDDPFFVDLGGIFDLGQTRSQYGNDPANPDNARDGLAGFNTHSIAMQIPIAMLQKDGKSVDQATSILDPDFVIGIWASASRPQIRTLSPDGDKPSVSGDWIQISRLGMPLTNEVIIPIGEKDNWNSRSPGNENQDHKPYFFNPELALYMDDDQFGGAVPSLSALRVQRNSLGAFDFGNGEDGLYSLKGTPDVAGTALADTILGNVLLPGPGLPRSVDIWAIFFAGVPNFPPYQLATGKPLDNPLAPGKPFIHNFLPPAGDMLRLNMSVPPTPRDDPDFSSLGLVQAAVLGLTDSRFNQTTDLQFIPNMDGFPNGRRLEDDVTTIELQAVSGAVLAAIGLWYDDFDPTTMTNPVTDDLLGVLNYNAGPTANDVPFSDTFPYLATPHRGYDYVKQLTATESGTPTSVQPPLGLSVPKAFILDQNYPNPFNPSTTIQYHVKQAEHIRLKIYNALGQEVTTLVDEFKSPGTYSLSWDAHGLASGTYYYRLEVGGEALPAKKALLIK